MVDIFFSHIQITYQKSTLIDLELRPPYWKMAAKFKFFSISRKTVGLTKKVTKYIIKEQKIFHRKCSMLFFPTSDSFNDIGILSSNKFSLLDSFSLFHGRSEKACCPTNAYPIFLCSDVFLRCWEINRRV